MSSGLNSGMGPTAATAIHGDAESAVLLEMVLILSDL
jgi:hypothetical protein